MRAEQHGFMSPVPAPLPDRLGDAFSVRSARAAGVSVRRLRHQTLDAPFRGTRTRSPATDDQAEKARDDESRWAAEARRLTKEIALQARALSQVAPATHFFCHVTAAVLWGLPVPLRLLRAALLPTVRNGVEVPARGIDVGVMAPGRAARTKGTRGYRLSSAMANVAAVKGLRVSDPASTWALLASELTVDELIELGDAIVNIPRRRGMIRGTEADALATMDELATAANTPYRRHAGKLRAALAEVRVGSASVAETRIRRDSTRSGLPAPELDYDVFALNGIAIGFTELAYPEYHLLIEYEGDHHRTDRDQWQRDVDKHRACAEAGWEVLRLTAKDVFPTTKPAIAFIRSALIRAGWRPGQVTE